MLLNHKFTFGVLLSVFLVTSDGLSYLTKDDVGGTILILLTLLFGGLKYQLLFLEYFELISNSYY